jgi:hypothetical protein
MHRELDDNLYDKRGKYKHDDDCDNNDVDINITINTDGDRKHFPPFGGAARGIDLNLCDVANGIDDVIRGRSAVAGVSGLEEFKKFERKREEPPFIDCEWGRLLEQNKQEMILKSAKLGAALRGSQG